jgi:hypothetical protein
MDESSYAYLLGLYLGDGHIVHGPRDVYVLAIACSDDWPGLMAAARQAMAAVMPASSVCGVKQTGCTMKKSYSKHWACLFPQHGPGRKHQRKIELAQWQEVIVRKYPGEFARGLFHSDGWRGVNRVRRTLADGDHWYEYPRYLFGNESADILRLCGEALDQLGVAWRYSRRNSISVARRGAVARLASAARRERTLATSASLAVWSVTIVMALRIASADSGLLMCSSSSATAFTSLSLSWLPSRANNGT